MHDKGMDVAKVRESLVDAALPHVPFDGWSERSFLAAAEEAGVAPGVARVVCPRGALDLAVAWHRRGDAQMRARVAAAGAMRFPGAMRFRDRVATALRWRLEAADREVMRRSAALFALPQNAAVGAALIWETADEVWSALGDSSEDFNWYTKRASLSAVWSAVVLYWLGDDTPGQAATWEFLDRRIGDVMRFEKLKARLGENAVLNRVLAGPLAALGRIRRPARHEDLPGRVR